MLVVRNVICSNIQVCDLQTVHLMVRFSCNFTQKEIQDRWFALLYDPMVSRYFVVVLKTVSHMIKSQRNNFIYLFINNIYTGGIHLKTLDAIGIHFSLIFE